MPNLGESSAVSMFDLLDDRPILDKEIAGISGHEKKTLRTCCGTLHGQIELLKIEVERLAQRKLKNLNSIEKISEKISNMQFQL